MVLNGVYGNQLFEFIDQAIDKIPNPDRHELSNVDLSNLDTIKNKNGLRKGQCLAFQSF